MKIETIIEPNDHIFRIQSDYMKIIEDTLPNVHVEAVGGMAVPMVGRPELDIIVISEDVKGDSKKIEGIGFNHRGFADDASYLKKIVDGVDVTVQVMLKDNKLIDRHRKVINLLRSDDSLRREYEEYKRTLSGLDRQEYREKKVAWLKANILPRLD